MGRRAHRVNGEIYVNARGALKVPGCREDLSNVADEIRRKRDVVYAAYERRNVPEENWKSMYDALVVMADKKAIHQRKISNFAEGSIPTARFDLCHRR